MDTWALENLDTDHRVAAVPLFVVDVEKVEGIRSKDFAIGLRGNNDILRCIQFRDGAIEPVLSRGQSYALLRNFERLLESPYLQTVPQYLGREWMIKDPEKRRELAGNYDNSRQTSDFFIDKLKQQFESLAEKLRGVELGCGTGNYTLPMTKTFAHVGGLDVSEEMLDVAKNKPGSDHVEWVSANALRSTLPTDYYDGVWGVSMLHYFRKEQQRMLFREIFRILKPGGRVVLDIEFEEQHGSLWIVEFFPSLRKRYGGRILSCDLYSNWLKEIGFKSLEFEQFDLSPADRDKSLRCGQHDPNLYLEDEIVSNIPAFSEMDDDERLSGFDALRRAIADRSIGKVIAKYVASMPGDIGVIIAEK